MTNCNILQLASIAISYINLHHKCSYLLPAKLTCQVFPVGTTPLCLKFTY